MITNTVQVIDNYKGFDVIIWATIEETGEVMETWEIFDHKTGDEVRGDHWFTSLQEVIDWIDRPEIWLKDNR